MHVVIFDAIGNGILFIEKACCIMYIKRKPEPMGHQFSTVVDKESGILLNFELNEGKDVNYKKYFKEFGATI